jgi:hypothetical protein
MENLPDGDVRFESLSDEDATALLKDIPKITGCFEFGPVPSDRKDRAFKQILEGINARTGVSLPAKSFFSEIDGAFFPLPLQVLRITPERPMLCVGYAFTIHPGTSILSGGSVEPENLSFRLVSCQK